MVKFSEVSPERHLYLIINPFKSFYDDLNAKFQINFALNWHKFRNNP
jgi:hypothetical protein